MKRILMFCLQVAIIAITLSVIQSLAQRSSETEHPNFKSVIVGPLRQEIENPPSETTETSARKNCICSKIYDPVCASNNESYFNLCFMECKLPKGDNVSVIHQGNCIPFRR